jgi:D-alanine--poly(phosphoribitol) ligase subunit 1
LSRPMQKLAIEYLLATRERFADRTALVSGEESVTFSELWRRGVELGHGLARATGAWNTPFVIDIEKSTDAVAAMVGVQLSGNIYVPFDVETPRERRRRALDSLGPHFVLDREEGRFRLDGTPLPPAPDPVETMQASLLEGLERRSSLDPLYIMFTSGSTGVPKGVTIANGSVIDYIDWLGDAYEVDEHEVIGNMTPLYFDGSVPDIYLTLARGSTLHLVPRESLLMLPSLLDYLDRHAVSSIAIVPSVLSNIAALRLLDDCPLPALRKVIFAGESMPPGTLRYLRERLPHARLSNMYGPTEGTVGCIHWTSGPGADGESPVPLGVPCGNRVIVLLGEDGRVVEGPDTTGEICIGGAGVALGYWNDPERTSAVFIRNPGEIRYPQSLYRTGDLAFRSSKDGLFYLVGRRDDQIKHMGHRIEPGEIESALNRVERVVHSSVQYDVARKTIVAFYCAEGGGEIPRLREKLADELPAYMLPGEFVALGTIPFSPSGKVDRAALWEIRSRLRNRTAGTTAGTGTGKDRTP